MHPDSHHDRGYLNIASSEPKIGKWTQDYSQSSWIDLQFKICKLDKIVYLKTSK